MKHSILCPNAAYSEYSLKICLQKKYTVHYFSIDTDLFSW